jgi:CRISPR-associated exonuclease Cas4
MTYLALILLVLALVLFWQASRRRAAAGLPSGRVVYADTSRWQRSERPLFDPTYNLTGRPDYLVEQNGVLIPVEVKSSWAPAAPHPGHLVQLAVYCMLVEKTTNRRPPYGLIHYRNRTFAVDYNEELEALLVDTLTEMRRQERQGEADRSHEDPARCERCGYRSICDQRL